MRLIIFILLSSLWLTGCIVFDKKSTSVNFYQLSAPVASPQKDSPIIFVPRAQIPSSLRRPNLVLTEEKGELSLNDNTRWVSPLDRAISETIARNITLNTQLPTTAQTPSGDHFVLLIDVSEFNLGRQGATLHLSYRLETDKGDLIKQGYGKWENKANNDPASLVKAQSINLANAAGEISQVIINHTPSPAR
jgi:uncharacterized lipoprotein YmbA